MPHFAQRPLSMVWVCFGFPAIASTGHPLTHRVQPLHFSGSMWKSTSALQLAAGHFRWSMWASYSFPKYFAVVRTGLGAVWPSPHRLDSLI